MDISFDYYKVFYEVARCQNITQAALNLCLTQPTVTKYIHNLEDMLQCKLFNRSQKGVTLTDEGRIRSGWVFLAKYVPPDQPSLPADGTSGRDFKRIHEQSERQGFDRGERADNALLSASLY